VAPDRSDVQHFLGGARSFMYVAQENLRPCEALESRLDSDAIASAFRCYDEVRA
jgi:hypothetical protein